jgi:hypothetical protein
MGEKTHRLFDIIVKALGFGVTILTICIGINQFNSQLAETRQLESDRLFWQKQNEIFTEMCENAGLMVSAINDEKQFEKAKNDFLHMYYGEMILVEDSAVESAMRDLKYYISILKIKDQNMVNIFKRKVIELADACRNASQTFKRRKL